MLLNARNSLVKSVVRLSRSYNPNKAALSGSTIQSLQAAFRDPSSPFHIPPGTTGPASPDDPPESYGQYRAPVSSDNKKPLDDASSNRCPIDAATQARNRLISLGYDASSLWEQSIVWGHHDAFRHVNNAHYLRFIESGRIQWMTVLGHVLGGKERIEAMLAGQGVSLILKSVNVNYRRPVTFPDTLLVGHKPIVSSSRTQFTLAAVLYSYAQQAVVADSESVVVWYDYDTLKKCDPGDEAWRVLKEVMDAEEREALGRPPSRPGRQGQA